MSEGKTPFNYAYFSIPVDSDFPVALLAEGEGGEGQRRLRLRSGEHLDPGGFTRKFSWNDPSGSPICNVYVSGDQYQYEWPGSARFLIENQQITCFPEQECPDHVLEHLLVHQVMPRWYAHQGNLVIHASAVRWPSGDVCLFIGDSGRGKSTTAAGMVYAGAELIADDHVFISLGEEGLSITGYSPFLRFKGAMREALEEKFGGSGNADGSADSLADRPHTVGPRLAKAGVQNVHLYVLEDPAKCVAAELNAMPLSATDAFQALMGSTFSLDQKSEANTLRQFRQISELLRSGIQPKLLSFNRDLEQLERLANLVSMKEI